MIRRPQRRRVDRLGRSTNDHATAEEAFRVLRSNVQVALAEIEQPTVVVTSAEPNEGKTQICTRLALSFTQAGLRVVLVDLDLRHPNVHSVVGGHNEFGVSDILLGQRKLDECLQYVEIPGALGSERRGLYFLATGHPVTNPPELLGMGRTARMIQTLSQQADLVLLDTPPVLPVADTLVIGRMASGAILVAEAKRTAYGTVQKAKDQLIRNQTRMLGIVVNKFQERYAGYGYGYGYGYGNTPADTSPESVEQPNSTNGSAH